METGMTNMNIRNWDRNLKVRLFGEFMMNVTFWMFFPFLTIYFTEAFGKTTAGLLLIMSQLLGVFANLMGGHFADRFGRKRMMVLSSFANGIVFFIFAMVNSTWLESALLSYLCFALLGVFGSFYWPASQAMVADVVDEKHRSEVFAVFYTSINIAVVFGPILGGIFYVHYRFELLLFAMAMSFVLSFLLYKWTRETAPKRTMDKEERQTWVGVLTRQFSDYRVIFTDKTFLLFILAGVLVAQTFMQLDLLIPVYTKDTLEQATLFSINGWSFTLMKEQVFGFLLSENGLLVALFTVVMTKWMSKYKEKNVFISSALVYAVAIWLFGQLSTMWGFIFAMALFTFGELMTAGIQQNFISKLAPEHMRGQYFAAASLRFTFGRTIAPLSIPVSLWLGYEGTFLLLALLSVLSAVLYYVMFQRFEKRQSQPVPSNINL